MNSKGTTRSDEKGMRLARGATDFFCRFPLAFTKVSTNRRYHYMLRKLSASVVMAVLIFFGSSSWILCAAAPVAPLGNQGVKVDDPKMTAEQALQANSSVTADVKRMAVVENALQGVQTGGPTPPIPKKPPATSPLPTNPLKTQPLPPGLFDLPPPPTPPGSGPGSPDNYIPNFDHYIRG